MNTESAKRLKQNYCLDCHKSFNEVKRFEDTNLCVDCFNKDQSIPKKNQDKKESPYDSVFLCRADNIAEANFIHTLLKENGIHEFYVPGSARAIYGIKEDFNFAVPVKDKEKAVKLLKENNIDIKNRDYEAPFYAARNHAMNYLKFPLWYWIFAVIFLAITLIIIIFAGY